MSMPTVCLNSSFTSSTATDRKSTRLNSSHDQISYAVFCLKKKNSRHVRDRRRRLRFELLDPGGVSAPADRFSPENVLDTDYVDVLGAPGDGSYAVCPREPV